MLTAPLASSLGSHSLCRLNAAHKPVQKVPPTSASSASFHPSLTWPRIGVHDHHTVQARGHLEQVLDSITPMMSVQALSGGIPLTSKNPGKDSVSSCSRICLSPTRYTSVRLPCSAKLQVHAPTQCLEKGAHVVSGCRDIKNCQNSGN